MTLTPLLLALALQTGGAAPQTPPVDPAAVLRTISDSRRAAGADKTAQDAATADAKTKAVAAIAGVDPAKVPAAQAESWAELFRLADHPDEATTLGERALEFHSMRAWEQQQRLISTYIAKGDKEKILHSLAYAQGTSVPMLGQLGEAVVFGVSAKWGETDPAFVLRAYDTILARFDLARPMAEDQKSWTRFAVARLGANRDALLYKTGKEKEALADLARLRTVVAGDERALSAVDEVAKQLEANGKPAPEIPAERTIGTYAGIGALKGKVVVLDFFAHWCGPCKRAFPDLRALYADAKPKGLEVVGVTSFQGYYGDQQGVKPDAEFALMRDKFVPEFKLSWPVIFERGKAGSKAYGVSGIPHLVVIDRKGNVRRVVVGYTPEEFKGTRAFVESLLAEK